MGGRALGLRICVCADTHLFLCMNGSSGPQNQLSGTKPTTGVPQCQWCVCACACVFVHCVSWHVCDMRMFMARGHEGRERVGGGGKGRATDREGGEDQ